MTAQTRKAAIAGAFGQAAAAYERHASVQAEAAGELAGLIGALALPPRPLVLEIGCGTGLLTRRLRDLPGAHGLITDLAPPMVAACRAAIGPAFHYVCMDGEAVAAPDGVFDLIAASLVFQWFEQPCRSITRLGRLLAPGGWLAFATLGPGTLDGWRQSCIAEALPPPTLDFPDPAALLQGWPGRARFTRRTLRQPHASGRAFLAGLRGLGARTPRPAHRPLTPAQLARVLRRFERDHDATARYELIHAVLQA